MGKKSSNPPPALEVKPTPPPGPPKDGFFIDTLVYSDYKAQITTKGPDGKPVSIFTTWRADIIRKILTASLVGHFFNSGFSMNITIKPNNEKEEL